MFTEGKQLRREKVLKYLDITFDRSLCGNLHISRTIVKARKGLVALKIMQHACLIRRLCQVLVLILSAINYDFVLLTLSATHPKRLTNIHNKAMRTIHGYTKDS